MDVQGFIFGGFTETAWASDVALCAQAKGEMPSPGAFLFSLRCHAGLEPTKMPLIDPDDPKAVSHYGDRGPRFGSGELVIHSRANDPGHGKSRIKVGRHYQCPAGQDGKLFLTGAEKFTAAEIEVFRVGNDIHEE
jgi:hypothetical protein